MLVLGRREPGVGQVKSGIEPSFGLLGRAVTRDVTAAEPPVERILDGSTTGDLDEAAGGEPEAAPVGFVVPKSEEGSMTGKPLVIGMAVGRTEVEGRLEPFVTEGDPDGAFDGAPDGLFEGTAAELFGGFEGAAAPELFGGVEGAAAPELFGGEETTAELFRAVEIAELLGGATDDFGGVGGAEDGAGAFPLS